MRPRPGKAPAGSAARKRSPHRAVDQHHYRKTNGTNISHPVLGEEWTRDAGRQSINQLPGSAKPASGSQFGVREMATQIVMDRTGDTRHTFDIHNRAEVAKGRAAIHGIDRRRLYGSGAIGARRAAGYPRLRSDGGRNAVLSATRWWLTAVTEQIVLAICSFVLALLRHAAAFGAFAGRGAIWFLQQIVPLRNARREH